MVKIICILLTVIELILFVGLQYILCPIKSIEEPNEFKKSNPFSSSIYLSGVAFFLYKVNKQLIPLKNYLFCSMFSLVVSMITLYIMITVVWGMVEYLMLDFLPASTHEAMHRIGYDLNLDLPFVLLLWFISLSFLMFAAQKSDILLEKFSNLFSKDDLDDCPSFQVLEVHSQSASDIEDEENVSTNMQIGEVHHVDPRVADALCVKLPITYRQINTLPTQFVSPPSKIRHNLRSRSSHRRLLDHQ